jgi:ATP-dependent Clp protease ATP-binding subunit ClpA
MPQCVLLLDEIEKAHPVVWNTFLQVFDAGRLTNSRGTTVDFGSVVIVMTSNIGAAHASAPPLGFTTAGADLTRARDQTVRAVKETMALELVNRIDELVVFDPLGLEAIAQIAERELERSCHRLAESGWSVRYDHDVVSYLVSTTSS